MRNTIGRVVVWRATSHNLGHTKARGVRDMAFHKRAGLRIEDMVKSRWVYRLQPRPLHSAQASLTSRIA
jgi:hypothetical protein